MGEIAKEKALEIAVRYGGIDGDHHKAWVIDQMVRALLDNEETYRKLVNDLAADGYVWNEGVAP